MRLRKLTKRQLAFMHWLRKMSGSVVSEDAVRVASGLSQASWAVYTKGGRYGPYLASVEGGLLVTADGHLSEEEFHAQVTQSKSGQGRAQSRSYQSRYVLSRIPLGEGGFAEVFRATERETSTEVALKRAKENEAARQRIDREIEAMSRLKHKNVMPVLDYDDTHLWYTMPLAVRMLVRDGNIPDCPVPLASMVRDVLAALEHSHLAHGFVHRDVTPANILLISTEGHIRWVLSDWGIVRNPKGQTTVIRTRTNSLLGTDQFAAPELWLDAHDADYRADFYGLGRVVAWLLGCQLVPNVPTAPSGDWSEFVSVLSAMRREDRPSAHDDVRNLIPRDSPASRVVLVGESDPRLTESSQPQVGGAEVALEALVEAALDEYVVSLVDSDEHITSRIAETNASGFYVDEIEVLWAGPLDVARVRIPFAASIHLSGEQDSDRMFSGDGITASLYGELEHDRNAWTVVECEVRDAEIDDYSD
jgi:hypothetical protein